LGEIKQHPRSVFCHYGACHQQHHANHQDIALHLDHVLSRSDITAAQLKVVGSVVDLFTAFRTSVDTGSRAAHEMLVALLGRSTLPALGQHHVWLLLGQRSILKVIHALSYPVVCTTAGKMASTFTARNIEAAESRPK